MFKVSVVQYRPELFDIERNVEYVINLVKDVETDFIVFPELAFTGYAYSSKEELEKTFESPLEDKGYAFNTFREFSKDYGINIVYGFNEKIEGNFFNSAILITKEGSFKIYRKTHLFYKEKLFFEPGNTGFWVTEIEGVKVGLAICFDWYFPESFRTLALLGADIIFHPANLVMPYCQEANKIRSLENKVYIATSNIWGNEKNGNLEYSFTGKSQITSPSGEVILRLPEKGDCIETIEANEYNARIKEINKYNDLFKDRKPIYYFHS